MSTSRPDQIVPRQDESIGELFSKLAGDASSLIRQEFRLAVVETKQNAARGVRHASLIAAGGVIGVIGIGVLTAAIVLLLALWLPAWLAAGIVGIALCVISLLVVKSGYSALKNTEIVPDDSIASIKESTEWLKEQIKN